MPFKGYYGLSEIEDVLFRLRKRRDESLNTSTEIKASLAFQIHHESTKQELSNAYLIGGSKRHFSYTFHKINIRRP